MLDIGIEFPEKKPYLNIGCGPNYSHDWFNIDSASGNSDVIVYNILSGLPFRNDSLEVIYSSHVLEHLREEEAIRLLQECFRTLKKGGILRIVIPDLEDIIDEYLRLRKSLSEDPSNEIIALKYKWILLEMFDQPSRNYTGGQMKEFIQSDGVKIEEYIKNRLGSIADELFETGRKVPMANGKENFSFLKIIKRLINKIRLSDREKELIATGKFRESGEVHFWMYDKVSIKRLLTGMNFSSVSFMTAITSNIKDWEFYNLDIVNNKILHRSSIFVEAVK